MQPDTENGAFWAKLGGAIATVVTGGWALMKFIKSALDAKLDREAFEHYRVTSDEQVTRHHDAILDLYRKNEKVVDLLREKEQRDSERHERLLAEIHNLPRKL